MSQCKTRRGRPRTTTPKYSLSCRLPTGDTVTDTHTSFYTMADYLQQHGIAVSAHTLMYVFNGRYSRKHSNLTISKLLG